MDKIKALERYEDKTEVYLGECIKKEKTLVHDGKGIKKYYDGSTYIGEFFKC